MTRVLVAYGSKRRGTAGLAGMIGDALIARGLFVDVRPASEVGVPDGYDAAIVAGALYANRWHPDARRFVRRRTKELRRLPVWLVSSGPLDDSAVINVLAPVRQVTRLASRIGARGMVTFGGRLEPDASGFLARSMAKTRAGDWRDREHIDTFADAVAVQLAPHPEKAP